MGKGRRPVREAHRPRGQAGREATVHKRPLHLSVKNRFEATGKAIGLGGTNTTEPRGTCTTDQRDQDDRTWGTEAPEDKHRSPQAAQTRVGWGPKRPNSNP